MTPAVNSTSPVTSLPAGSPVSMIVFDDVSKFYGEILGVNRVSL